MPHSDTNSDTDSEAGLDLFEEPADFRPPDKPATTAQHTLVTGDKETLNLRLVGHNPLWGHMLWNAGRVTSEYLERRASELIKGKTVLELGAGAGLPSLVCAVRGAAYVVITDYPDPDLVSNLSKNIENCLLLPSPRNITEMGYIWGRDVTSLLSVLPVKETKFDLLILSDLLFNHSQHKALAETVRLTLATGGRALVFFTPHRPWLYADDLKFFEVAEEVGFSVEKVLEEKLEAPMFEEDPGDRELRRTVFGYELRWREGVEESIGAS